ncbi:uncharacterized protein EMH_0067510 [Eimeria mitis]|uniref:Uncharacterized protein n=1 Tax=Eimeria mitis TaxID=44415 RepID=U6K3G8_9EIME|nr:uncharacterized protein EMH_0067510 [Eimeria mitis]CDJ31521.1 hypothetical protein, conserved [Eimeria mitis]
MAREDRWKTAFRSIQGLFELTEECSFTVANGEIIKIHREVPRLTIICGGECFTGNFLVGQVPYAVILGIDWLDKYRVAWFFESDKLRTYVNGRTCSLPVLRREGERPKGSVGNWEADKTEADCAYEELANQISKMTAEEAAVFLRSPTKRYKAKRGKAGRIKIKEVINQARKNTEEMKGTIQGLNCIVMLPEAEVDVDQHKPIVGQGHMICAILERPANPADRKRKENCLWDQGKHEDKEESPWPNAILEFTEFDKWIEGVEARSLPVPLLQLLGQYRPLFPDSLPNGLPPKRPFDHRILLIPGKLPTKAPIYKMPPDHLLNHSQEIERLCAKGWISPTYSPICAPTIMLDKRDDGSGERKRRLHSDQSKDYSNIR